MGGEQKARSAQVSCVGRQVGPCNGIPEKVGDGLPDKVGELLDCIECLSHESNPCTHPVSKTPSLLVFFSLPDFPREKADPKSTKSVGATGGGGSGSQAACLEHVVLHVSVPMIPCHVQPL